MTFKRIEYGSADYALECELRDRILRAPLGMSLSDDNLAAEARQLHFGLFDGSGALHACVIAVPLSPTTAKIRQMAVSEAYQNQGCGRQIMASLEEFLAGTGHVDVALHARGSAVGFYEKLGYARIGGEFTEVGLPHFQMAKHLSRKPVSPDLPS